MAITDIPEFIKASPGDLITAKSWDDMQKMMRSSLRLHQHSRVPGTPATDTDSVDIADQIVTAEIADGAVTAVKIAAGSISTASIPDGAITTAKIADLAIATPKLANASVTSAKLSFAAVGSGSASLAPQATQDVQVALALTTTKTAIYFPSITILSSTGAGFSAVTAQLLYRQTVGVTTVDLFLRLFNSGGATAGVIWQVHTFS